MSTKPRSGSMLEAETKSDKIILAVLAVVTVLLWFAWYVFDTDQRLFVRRAGTFAKIVGTLSIAGSWVWCWYHARNFLDAKGAIGWLLLLAFGLMCSSGFNFDYFNAW